MHNERRPEKPLTQIEKSLLEIIMRLSDLLTANASIAGQLSKIETEIKARFVELNARIDQLVLDMADASLTAEQEASLTAVQTAVDSMDSIVPDPVVVTPPVVETPPVV